LEFSTIKGFKDILPAEIGTWRHVELETRRIFRAFGFQEIKPPLLEVTELFSRSIGEDTDIVSKEMYSFTDSKGKSFSLRPEATASVVRAYIQHRLYQKNPIQKLFIIGPMFRHERPQKGRFRQFYQIDAEIIGDPGPKSDADIIVLAIALVESLGLTDLSLEINSLGCPQCRGPFREELKNYLAEKKDALCKDCRRRAATNPLRVFDCKVQGCREVVSQAPSILQFICQECQHHFRVLQEYLGILETPFTVNHMLVRGLDYYTRTTFEIQTDRLGAQNAVVKRTGSAPKTQWSAAEDTTNYQNSSVGLITRPLVSHWALKGWFPCWKTPVHKKRFRLIFSLSVSGKRLKKKYSNGPMICADRGCGSRRNMLPKGSKLR